MGIALEREEKTRRMAITDPLNLLIIVSLLAVIIIWGPEKLPEIIRQINRWRAEYTKATTGVLSQLENLSKPLPSNVVPDPRFLTNDAKVIDVARKLGIATSGKTKNEITTDILNAIGDESKPEEARSSNVTSSNTQSLSASDLSEKESTG